MSAGRGLMGAPPCAAQSWLFRIITLTSCHVGMALSLPYETLGKDGDEFLSTKDPKFYAYLGVSIGLVLLGGAFAGLTIALMGQDEIYLQVIATSGDGAERRNSSKVLRLLKRGKHWVLVTLLVGNVITNETLPLVLDRCLGGGYAAAISSTVLVIVFGEIVPQSVCVRYGLPIGAWMSPFVLALMWVFSPITWPIAKLLDRILGEDHGTVYKKAGLKTLVTLHQTMGTTPNERLNDDEVSIIKGVLDLKAKSVGSIMTPMNDVFTLSADAILDEDMMHIIMREGYSRIPIHEPSNKGDFVGMLLVKILITYDPEDARKVCEFSLATLPETRPETSCLDIINFFQEGKSHMVLVSDFPGEPYGALGVVTLEDVIEELIGEEIIDESDVFIDVHKAIRRIQPAPTHKAWDMEAEPVSESSTSEARESNAISHDQLERGEEAVEAADADAQSRISFAQEQARSSRPTQLRLRQRKSLQSHDIQRVRGYTPEMKQQLKNLGPSNAAKQPKPSRVNTVKIKNAAIKVADESSQSSPPQQRNQLSRFVSWPSPVTNNNDTDIVGPGNSAKDGVQAIQTSNGALDGFETRSGPDLSNSLIDEDVSTREPTSSSHEASSSQRKTRNLPAGHPQEQNHEGMQDESPLKSSQYRASMSEQFIDSGGVKKLIIQMTSPDQHADDTNEVNNDSDAITRGRSEIDATRDVDSSDQSSSRTKQSKSRRKQINRGSDEADEQTPLITRGH